MADSKLGLPREPGSEPPLEEAAAWADQGGGRGGMSMAFITTLFYSSNVNCLFQLPVQADFINQFIEGKVLYVILADSSRN